MKKQDLRWPKSNNSRNNQKCLRVIHCGAKLRCESKSTYKSVPQSVFVLKTCGDWWLFIQDHIYIYRFIYVHNHVYIYIYIHVFTWGTLSVPVIATAATPWRWWHRVTSWILEPCQQFLWHDGWAAPSRPLVKSQTDAVLYITIIHPHYPTWCQYGIYILAVWND